MSTIFNLAKEKMNYYEKQLNYLKGCTFTIYDFCLLAEEEFKNIKLEKIKKQLNEVIDVLEKITEK